MVLLCFSCSLYMKSYVVSQTRSNALINRVRCFNLFFFTAVRYEEKYCRLYISNLFFIVICYNCLKYALDSYVQRKVIWFVTLNYGVKYISISNNTSISLIVIYAINYSVYLLSNNIGILTDSSRLVQLYIIYFKHNDSIDMSISVLLTLVVSQLCDNQLCATAVEPRPAGGHCLLLV